MIPGLGGGTANLGSMVYAIKASNQQFKTAATDTKRSMQDVSQKAEQNRRKMKAWGTAVTAAALAIAGATSRMAANFEYEMAQVHTLLGPDSEARIKELGDNIKQMAMETGKDLSDLTQGAYQVVSAFGDTADTAHILETAAKAATAGLSTTNDALELLSAVSKGYGDTSAEMIDHISDLAFTTVRLGQTTFPELANSIGRVTPLAATLNLQVEELFGSFATLTGVTGDANEVSTQLRGVLQGLLRPTDELRRVMNELGYESGEAMIEALGLQGTLEALYDATGRNNESLGEMFGNVRALTGVLPLVGDLADDFTRKTNEMTNAAGATNEAFKIMQETVQGASNQIKQMVQVTLLEVGEKFLPVVAEVLNKFRDLPPAVRETVTDVLALATGLGLVVGPLTIISALLPKIKIALIGLKASFLPFTAAGAITIGIIALVGHIRDLRDEVEEVGNAAQITTDQIKAMTDMTALSRGLEFLRRDIVSLIEEVNAGVEEHGELLEELLEYRIEDWAARGFSPEVIDAYLEELRDALEEGVYDPQWATLGIPEHLFDEMVKMAKGSVDEVSDAWHELSDEQQDALLSMHHNADLAYSRMTEAQREHLLEMLEQRLAVGERVEELTQDERDSVGETADEYKGLKEELEAIEKEVDKLAMTAKALAEPFDATATEAELLKDRIAELIEEGATLEDEVLAGLIGRLRELQKEMMSTVDYWDEVEQRISERGTMTMDEQIRRTHRLYRDLVTLGEMSLDQYIWFLEQQLENDEISTRLRAQIYEEYHRLIEDDTEETTLKIIDYWAEVEERIGERTRMTMDQQIQRSHRLYQALVTLGKMSEETYANFLRNQLRNEELTYQQRASMHNELAGIIEGNMRSLEQEAVRRYQSEEAQVRWLKQELQELAKEYEDHELLVALIEERIQSLSVTTEEAMEEMKDATTEAFEAMGEVVERELSRLFTDLVMDAENATEAIARFFDALARSIVQSMADALAERAVQQLLGLIIGGGVPVPAGGGGAGARTAHTGGLLTDAGLVQDMPSYHSGGLIKPDEHIIKAQTGERILSRDQNTAFEKMMGDQGGVVVINAVDEKSFSQKLKDHDSEMSSIVTQQMQNNAALRELIKQLMQGRG